MQKCILVIFGMANDHLPIWYLNEIVSLLIQGGCNVVLILCWRFVDVVGPTEFPLLILDRMKIELIYNNNNNNNNLFYVCFAFLRDPRSVFYTLHKFAHLLYSAHRSLTPVFESRCGYIWRVFHLLLHFITFGVPSAHLTYHVHKSDCKKINHHHHQHNSDGY